MELQLQEAAADLQQLFYTRAHTLIILLLMVFLSLNKVELAPSQEVEALLQLKAHLSKPSQALLTGWDANNTGSLCTDGGAGAGGAWVGVTCSHLNGNIQAINLTNLGLAGSLAPHLGNLTSLTSLELQFNSLSGPIPPQLSGCSSLHLLHLDFNNFTGPIPSSLASLSSLQILGLCSNRLSGPMPQALLTNLTSLLTLSLCLNALTGSIPTHINTPHLRKLLLENNYLTGHIPPSLLNCTQLTDLELNSNMFTGPIPSQLGLLSLLEYLELGHIDTFDAAVPGSMQDGGTFLTFTAGPIPQSLGNCTQLIFLSIDFSALTGSIPTELTMLSRLQLMSFEGNQLSGDLKFSNSTSLNLLTVHSNYLTSSIPAQLRQLKGLQLLDLQDNSFSGLIPLKSLSNCSSLQLLSLSKNHLQGTIPSNFGSFQNLQYLYLQRNLIQGGIPNFEGSRFLALDLSFNQLNGSVPSSLADAASTVSTLDLSHNQLSGSLPSGLGDLAMAQTLNLSYNHFVGPIPEGLGNCLALTALSLSHNGLSAGLPMQLGNLTYLETLDLSSNNLTGLLPSFLESMNRLHFLDVSFNNFTGTIPLLGIFKHLNSSSLQGNPGLCGPIINKACPTVQSFNTDHHRHFGRKAILAMALALPAIVVAMVLIVLAIMHRRVVKARPRPTCLEVEARKYTADELTKATQGYSEENVLGRGGFSLVYKAVLSDGTVVAAKKFRDVSFRKELLQEVEIVSKLRHRNLVRVLGCVLNLEVNVLVLEYMSNRSLEHYLDHHEQDGWSWRMLTKVVCGIANALKYLHHEYGIPIIHGDVKPNNILLDSDFEAHLADFGLAKLVNEGAVSMSSNLRGSIGYMAPEYTYSAQITTKVDVYSFGVVILQLLTGRKATKVPGSVSLHEWLKTKVLHGVGLQEVLHASLSNGINDHIAACLLRMGLACTQDRPTDRPTMQEICALLFYIKVE